MDRILDGLLRFQAEIFPQEKELFSRLARTQNPQALFLTCSDSRIVPELITQTRPGDLFICRNAGNIAPAYGQSTGGVSATIEYAVLALGVRDIIICGHSDCGAMKALLYPESLSSMPVVASWLKYAERARFLVSENYTHLEGDALLRAVTEQTVIAQIDNLRTHPSVAARLHKGELTLHGWVYDIPHGQVSAYDPGAGCFVPITEVQNTAGTVVP
ncbi:MAG TPA: carbonic anhydrase [Bryobacteraceae bacterium]|nr:carbonic anhydrase [Bryobacteraceae bacterium]